MYRASASASAHASPSKRCSARCGGLGMRPRDVGGEGLLLLREGVESGGVGQNEEAPSGFAREDRGDEEWNGQAVCDVQTTVGRRLGAPFCFEWHGIVRLSQIRGGGGGRDGGAAAAAAAAAAGADGSSRDEALDAIYTGSFSVIAFGFFPGAAHHALKKVQDRPASSSLLLPLHPLLSLPPPSDLGRNTKMTLGWLEAKRGRFFENGTRNWTSSSRRRHRSLVRPVGCICSSGPVLLLLLLERRVGSRGQSRAGLLAQFRDGELDLQILSRESHGRVRESRESQRVTRESESHGKVRESHGRVGESRERCWGSGSAAGLRSPRKTPYPEPSPKAASAYLVHDLPWLDLGVLTGPHFAPQPSLGPRTKRIDKHSATARLGGMALPLARVGGILGHPPSGFAVNREANGDGETKSPGASSALDVELAAPPPSAGCRCFAPSRPRPPAASLLERFQTPSASLEFLFRSTAPRRQRTEDRGQRTEDRGQRTEAHRTEDGPENPFTSSRAPAALWGDEGAAATQLRGREQSESRRRGIVCRSRLSQIAAATWN
ncbi:hypothetical protein JHW43_002617 [Diplocarpon mali]|nr:hypothetical protein JHW43_002617 [Diplocarpon mali]